MTGHTVGIALDGSGRVCMAGETDSRDFPLVAPLEGAPPLAGCVFHDYS